MIMLKTYLLAKGQPFENNSMILVCIIRKKKGFRN